MLLFGLAISAEVFQENCTSAFLGIDNLFIHVDDLLNFGETKEQHDEALEKVLNRAMELKIKFNHKKFQYLQSTTKYFGHEIGCLLPDKE